VSISIAQVWRAFRDDEPGQRFENHYQLMRQEGSRVGAIARLTAGVALVAAGIVMLFVPGPGILVMLFGFGLIGGESKAIASAMDRVEPALREKGRRAKRWWRFATWPARVAVIALAALGAGIAGTLALRIVT
jgi:hypothetical protein